ncbi:hypothetical protein [Streptomyces lycii]|uniref:Uncharacterized protein n=1 Tax=Streptomyces lycii TaxID=2654337 RepID=A0ABQ7FND5_9ACTN|nr:hypothetical protein [Streptomyces lycii]KAF4408758.1 hypothetical protein GCU69_12620 [Streptomyces lycii]
MDQVAYFGAKSILVVEERAGVSFLVPGGLPNDALDALTRADLMALAAPDPEDGKVVIWWDGDSREWRRSVEAG